MWKYRGTELGLEGIIGVPNTDMTDEEFSKANAKILRNNPGAPFDTLEKSGLWEHMSDRQYGRAIKAEAEAEAETQPEEINIEINESENILQEGGSE